MKHKLVNLSNNVTLMLNYGKSSNKPPGAYFTNDISGWGLIRRRVGAYSKEGAYSRTYGKVRI